MTTFEELAIMLDEVKDGLPTDIYKELNGGVIWSPDVKMHPEALKSGDLYIMGEYHNDRQGYGGLGRYIIIYFGSFMKLYSYLPPKRQKEQLSDILKHELTHHWESLAGERDLEVQDAIDMARYRQMHDTKPSYRLRRSEP